MEGIERKPVLPLAFNSRLNSLSQSRMNNLSFGGVADNAEKDKELKKLDLACKDFESIFVFQMMKEMRKTIHKTGLISGGQAEEIFSDMLDQERSINIAKNSSLGLANILFRQLSLAINPAKRNRL